MKRNLIKICSLGLALSLAVGLVGCGGNAGSGSGSSSSASGSTSGGTDTVTIDYSKGITADGMWEGVKALDYVTLPQYKGLDLPADKITPTQEEIDGTISEMLASFATKEQIKDRAVVKDDLVNIDYVGSVGGVEFTGGNTGGTGTTVTAGSANYIDDFLTQIIGHKPGETMNVVVTFPDDYKDGADKDGNVVKLAGQEAVFVTTINYIEGEDIYPELTDAFVAENLKANYGWSTAEEAKAEVKKSLEETNKYNYLLETIEAAATVSKVPESIVNTMVEQSVASAKSSATGYGLDFASFLTMMGYADEAAFEAAMVENSQPAAKQRLIFQAIAETENLSISDDDVKELFSTNYDQVIAQYGAGYVKLQLLADKVSELIMAEN